MNHLEYISDVDYVMSVILLSFIHRIQLDTTQTLVTPFNLQPPQHGVENTFTKITLKFLCYFLQICKCKSYFNFFVTR